MEIKKAYLCVAMQGTDKSMILGLTPLDNKGQPCGSQCALSLCDVDPKEFTLGTVYTIVIYG